ncbi:MAG: hypothetical protein Q7V31_03805 [Parvibaculum sp.]|uniref:hypothetical protein n=1 Tax=Parvibaculum sp. TaxID=2024848 RepID=UPI002725FB86|nr:hypothetical protein [Parvibaculum sp.]MDO8838028.1 hypothetical protein [Parvibaculum sp.]
MKKNLIFAAIFGLVFGLPLAALLVSWGMIGILESIPYVLLPVMAVLLALRYLTLMVRKAGAAGGRAMAGVAGRIEGAEAARAAQAQLAAEQAALAQETYLQMLLSLTAGVGGVLATVLAAIGPVVTFLLLTWLLGGLADGVMWAFALIVIASGIAGIFWLRLLERYFAVRILLPLIPLSVVWLAYAIIAFGVFGLVLSIFE